MSLPLDPEARSYVTFEQLLTLQRRGDGRAKRDLRVLEAGMQSSRLRGRGLDFEELKPYSAGDDVRGMDWRTTRRTGRPHVRVFSETKNLVCHLLLDQGSSMFFGSQRLKSVLAAQLAAAIGFAALDRGRELRLALLQSESEGPKHFQRIRRSQTWYPVLMAMAQANQKLLSDLPNTSSGFAAYVEQLWQRRPHEQLLVFIGDFYELSEDLGQRLTALGHSNELMFLQIFDPLEENLPERGMYLLGDGENQALLAVQDKALRERHEAQFQKSRQVLHQICKTSAAARWQAFDCNEPWPQQIHKLGGMGL